MEEIMLLQFKVNKQRLTRTDKNYPVEKSQYYLYAEFEFSEDWANLKKEVYFTWDNVHNYVVKLDENNRCLVPNEVIKSCGFMCWVKGYDETTLKLIPTNSTSVTIGKTGELVGEEVPISIIESSTLEITKDTYRVEINVPNKYGTKLSFDKATGKIQLLGLNNLLLSEIDLPTEKIVSDVRYDSENKKIIITWDNGQVSEIELSNLGGGAGFLDVTPNPNSETLLAFTLTTEQFEELKVKDGIHIAYNMEGIVLDFYLHKTMYLKDPSSNAETIILQGNVLGEITIATCVANQEATFENVVVTRTGFYIQDFTGNGSDIYLYGISSDKYADSTEQWIINLSQILLNSNSTLQFASGEEHVIDTHLVHDFTSLTIPSPETMGVTNGQFTYPSNLNYNLLREIDSVKFKIAGDVAQSQIITLDYYGKNNTQKIYYKLIPGADFMARIVFVIFAQNGIVWQQQTIPLIAYMGSSLEWSSEEKSGTFTLNMLVGGVSTKDPDTEDIIYMNRLQVESLSDTFNDGRGGYYSSSTIYDVYNDQNIRYIFNWYADTQTYKFTKIIEKIDDKIKNYLDNNLENGNTGAY